MTEQEFEHVIAFCVLMENGQGLIDKAPSYVMEKFNRCEVVDLDTENTDKYLEYMKLWRVANYSFEDE